jgi:hypothetical protein
MILKAKRETRKETRNSKKMGCLITDVTRIKLYLFGVIPIKQLHAYRETYYDEVKELEDCDIHR